jgi:carbonic anhydrase
MVIACADSRVDPAITLKLKPGDAFIIRNVANMVPPFESEGYPSVGSALEYAVLHLKVEHIVVVGHSACGGIGALIKMVPEDGNYATTFIERWVEIGKPARKEVNAESPNGAVADLCKTCEKTSVKNSLNNLLTYPFVVEAAKSKKITIHGGYYDFINGAFDTWDFEVPAEKAV